MITLISIKKTEFENELIDGEDTNNIITYLKLYQLSVMKLLTNC